MGTADGGLKGAPGGFWGTETSVFKNFFLPFQSLVIFPGKTCPPPSPPAHTATRLFHSGTHSGVVRRRGEAGASVSWLTRPWSRGGRVQRFPGATTGACAGRCTARTMAISSGGGTPVVPGGGSGTGYGLKNAGRGVWRCHMLSTLKAGPHALFSRTIQWPDRQRGVVTGKAARAAREGADAQIIAMPPFTCSVCPVT
jgi:hypothetical protein